MTLSLDTLKKYARTRKTRVIDGAYKIADDYQSAVFVLESGHKLTMTEAELEAAIVQHAKAAKLKQADDRLAKQTAKGKALTAQKVVEEKLGTTQESKS